MKKQKIANYLKTGILLFGVSVLLWNCEKQELNPLKPQEVLPKERISKSITFENLENTDVYQYFNKKVQLGLKTDKQLNLLQKGTQSSSNDITIVTQKVNQVINNGGETFSMFVKYKEQQENTYYNLVLYKKDNVYRIYTLKIETNSKLHGKGTATTAMETNVTVKPGIILIDGWDDAGDDSSTGGGDYKYQCKTILVEIDVLCTEDGHKENDPICNCGKPGYNCIKGYTDYNFQDFCEYVWVGTGNDPNYTGSENAGKGGVSTSTTGDTIDIKTVNPSDVVPEGTNSKDFINSVLSEKSPYKVDMTQILDSISLPPNDSTKIANENFLCLYNKLSTSNSFKNLFTNIFGGSQDVLNVKFKITKNLKLDGEKANGLRSVIGGTRNSSTGEIIKLNQLIEIDQDLLEGGSNYNVIKTILHESIHAFLTLKMLTCNNQAALDSYNNDDISKTINTLYNSFCASNQNQHDFMFNKMLPAFKTIFEEIGKTNLTSQGSIDFVESNQLYLNNNLSVNWSWDDFYHYYSMQGLHETDVFKNEIKNNSLKNDLYNEYRNSAKKFSKNCN